jgi:hypothetical protein
MQQVAMGEGLCADGMFIYPTFCVFPVCILEFNR